MNYPKVSIIILNWNGWKDAIECLESLYQITYPNYEVIVVDNGSEDDSIQKIKEYCEGKIEVESKFFEYLIENKPIKIIKYQREKAEAEVGKQLEIGDLPSHKKLILIKNEKNDGFAEGNNVGVRYALKALNPAYILLLNNDTVVDPDFLGELVKVGESDERIGIMGAVNYYYDKPEKIWFSGGKINFWNGKVYNIGVNEIEKEKSDKIREVDYVAGSCFCVTKEVIEKIGMLDHEYFVYWEEADWCVRALKAGYKVLNVPNAKIWHKVSSTSKKIVGFFEYYYTRNTFLFMKKHTTRIQFFSFILWFFVFNFWFRTSILLIYHKNMKALISFYKGIKDGLLRVMRG